MKIFTSSDGKFQLVTPVEWQYKNTILKRSSSEPHAFGDYEDNIGAFQISCRPLNENTVDLILKNRLPVHDSLSKINFSERYFHFESTNTYTWMAAIKDHFVLATFIYDDKNSGNIKDKLNAVHAVLESFKFIEEQFREHVLAHRRYDLFMYSTATVLDLRNKALENGSFIELVVLTANRIDALLRLALILQQQLNNSNDSIDTSLLYQAETDKPIMERAVYRMALQNGIISQNIFDRLETLYKERNRVVHRYIITDLRTQDIIDIVFNYYSIEDEIDVIINALEKEQFHKKIGVNANVEPGILTSTQRARLEAAIKDKHGNIEWEKAMDNSKI